MRGETHLARFLLPVFLCEHILSRERERLLGTRQNRVDSVLRSTKVSYSKKNVFSTFGVFVFGLGKYVTLQVPSP